VHSDELAVVDIATGRVQRRLKPVRLNEKKKRKILIFFIFFFFAQQMGTIAATCLLNGDRELMVAFDNQLIQHWLLSNEENAVVDSVLRSWKAHDAPVRVVLGDTSSQLLASSGADRTVMVRDIAREHFTHVLRGHVYPVIALAFHPDPQRHMLLSGDEGGVVYRWNLLDRKGVPTEAHTTAVTAIAITPDGKRAVSISRDTVLCVWDLDKFGVVRNVATNERLEGLAILPDNFAATAGERGFVRVWDLKKGGELRVRDGGGLGELTSLTASRDGSTLLATTSDLTFARFAVGARGAVQRERILIGDYDAIIDGCFLDGDRVAIACNSNLVRLIDLRTQTCTMLAGHTDLALALAVGGGGTRLVTCAKDRSLRVYQIASDRAPRCIAVCEGHTESVGAVACTSATRGSEAFVISGSRDTTLKVWHVGDPTDELPDGADDVDDDGLVVRDDSRGNEPARPRAVTTRSAHDKEINCVAVSPDDKLVASGSQDRTIRLWRLPRLDAVAQLIGHRRGVWSVRFAPREKLLVSASGDKSLRLWSLADNTCVRTFEGHATPVLRVAFISAGNQLLSTSSDGVLKLWNVADASCVNTFDGHDSRPWALAERHDGAQVLTGGEDGVLLLWRDRSAIDMAEAATKRAERVLGEQSLLNHERRGELGSALALAISLDMATRARSIVNRMIDDGAAEVPLDAATTPDSADAAPPSALVQCVSELSDEHLVRLLNYVRDWHATTRVATAGVRVLRAVLLARTPDQLLAFPDTRTALAALLPYAARHRRRAAQLAQRAELIGYVASVAGAGSVYGALSVGGENEQEALAIVNDDVLAGQEEERAAELHAKKRARVGGQ
jgi:U3 small nucleolar RNA-associated protein 13